MTTLRTALGAALLAAFACGSPGNGAAAERPAALRAPGPGTLVLARISNNPRKQIPRLQKMAAYLRGKLGDLGVRRIRAMTVPDRETMATSLRAGAVDLFSETVLSALYLERHGGAEILLREWKKGVASYRAVVVARKGGGISRLADLAGRTIAFEDRSSTSGFLVPLGALVQLGLAPVEMESPRSAPPPGRVGYVFAEEELNIAGWVVRGLVAAGAMADRDLAEITRIPGPIRDRLTVIYRSAPLPRSLFAVRRGLDPAIKSRIKAVLLRIHRDPAARRVLKAYYKVKKYDAVLELDDARRIRSSLAPLGL